MSELEETISKSSDGSNKSKKSVKLKIKKKKKPKKVVKTILTHRGYAIVKEHFGFRDINRTKKELTVSPYVNENYAARADPFPIYLESEKKLFLPKHYGFETFGDPDQIKNTAKGLDIDLEFNGSLREKQVPVVEAFLKSCEPGSLTTKSKGGILALPCGFGKTCLGLYLVAALKKKTLIIVHKEFLINQWKERIEQFLPFARVGVIQSKKVEIKNKDIVIGMLQSISMREYPWETFDDFGFTIVDECFPYNTPLITDSGIKYIGDLYEKWKHKKEVPNILSFNQRNNEFEYKKLTFAWRKYRKELVKLNFFKNTLVCTPEHKILTTRGYVEASSLVYDDIIISKYDDDFSDIVPKLNDDQMQVIYGSYLGKGKLIQIKPKRYSIEINSGSKDKNYCEWKADILGIRSLKHTKRNYISHRPSYSFRSIPFDSDSYLCSSKNIVPLWLIDNIDLRGLSIFYMDNGVLEPTYNNKYYIKISVVNFNDFAIEYLQQKFQKYGIDIMIFESDKSHIQLDTINTEKFLKMINKYICRDMKYKTIDFKINKTYPWNNKFENYGTTRVIKKDNIENNGYGVSKKPYVYDIEVDGNHNFIVSKNSKSGICCSNCHHIGAEVFSRALPKINSQYSLGLSATPKRKDGLSKVFHWFLGPTIYENKKREGLLPIHVNIAMYNCPDEKYNKMEVTGFGKICMARMVNNICDFERRTELVLYLTERLHKKGKKVLILSDRRAHLTEIFEKVEERKIATIGYYVGGMKEKDLKKSESKEVLLGTYTMSSEGMDIPDLDAVIFASPRSDIVQSIGRILRKKHETNPICWDIVDDFSVFPKQYTKRRAYYRRMKYPIKIYDINDDQEQPIKFMTDQFNNTPKEDKKKSPGKKKNKAKENIIVNDYTFIEDS